MLWLGSLFKLFIAILGRWFPVKTSRERRLEKIEKELKELDDYHNFLESRLNVAIVKRQGMQVAMLRRELRDVVDKLIGLRNEKATLHPQGK